MANLSLLSLHCVLLVHALHLEANAELTGPLIRHLSSILKWTRSSTRGHVLDADVIQFEDGYLMETVVEGKYFGVLPHSVHVSRDGDLFAVDSINNNIVRINTPLSQYSRARSIAGSSQGRVGHVDGKPSDARFNRPKGLAVDDGGNIYVADTANGAIRKIREGGVTTIAGGKSSTPGYRDGPSEQALFSNDFDIVYVRPMCSLIVLDRGNAALRQILLNREDCDYRDNLITFTEALMVAGAILAGYLLSTLWCHFRTFLLSTTGRHEASMGKDVEASCVPENTRSEHPAKVKGGYELSEEEERGADWASLRRLVVELGKKAAGFFHFLVRPEGVAPADEDAPSPPLPAKDPPFTKIHDPHRCVDVHTVNKAADLKATAMARHRGGLRKADHPEPHQYTGEEEAHHARSRGRKESSRHRQRETASGQDPRPDHSAARTPPAKYRHLDSFRF